MLQLQLRGRDRNRLCNTNRCVSARQAEADEKTRKLDKLRAKKEEAHDKWIAMQDEFRAEREVPNPPP